MPRPAGAREPADRGREAMAVSTERYQVVGRRGVRRRAALLRGQAVSGGVPGVRRPGRASAVRRNMTGDGPQIVHRGDAPKTGPAALEP